MIDKKFPVTGDADALPGLFDRIIYIIPVEDNDPYAASILQGFAPSLMRHEPIIRIINALPSDLWELTPEGREVRLARRMSGQAPVSWFGQSARALTSMITPVFAPFLVVFFGPDHDMRKYRKWIDSHPFPLVVIAEKGGVLNYDDLDVLSLRDAFLQVCDALKGKVRNNALENARTALGSWEGPKTRSLGYQVGGHNSVRPNLNALSAAGYEDMVYGPFEKINDGIGPYVEQICRTTRSILAERDAVGERAANQFVRRPPGVNLFAPAMYPHVREVSLSNGPFSLEDKSRFLAVRRALEKQEGYMFEAKTPVQIRAIYGAEPGEEPQPHFLMTERAAELSLATECIGTLAASEISAVLRLPNKVNRTGGEVRQFAQQYHAKKMNIRKRVDGFHRVQRALNESVPAEFFPFIEEAKDGIRLVCDAHLEWLKLRGLPLSIQKDVTRVPVTPGNLFIQKISPKNYIHLRASDFSEILILSVRPRTL